MIRGGKTKIILLYTLPLMSAEAFVRLQGNLQALRNCLLLRESPPPQNPYSVSGGPGLLAPHFSRSQEPFDQRVLHFICLTLRQGSKMSQKLPGHGNRRLSRHSDELNGSSDGKQAGRVFTRKAALELPDDC